jgi:hypothetical protein
LINDKSPNISDRVFGEELNKLINGEPGRTGLRGKYPEGVKWASFVPELTKEKYLEMPESIKKMIPGKFHTWQKPVIYTPILFAYQAIEGDFINMNELSNQEKLGLSLNADFDSEYFNKAYDLAIKYFYTLHLSI